MDLIYISVLLKDAYGLDNETKIKVCLGTFVQLYLFICLFFHLLIHLQLYKTVDGMEVTWALGCAYNLLDGMRRNKKDSCRQRSMNNWSALYKKINFQNNLVLAGLDSKKSTTIRSV